jgi:hypothetical protein
MIIEANADYDSARQDLIDSRVEFWIDQGMSRDAAQQRAADEMETYEEETPGFWWLYWEYLTNW